MAKLSTEELIAAFKELTLVELNDFVKAFEEEFEHKSTSPLSSRPPAPPPPRGGGGGPRRGGEGLLRRRPRISR